MSSQKKRRKDRGPGTTCNFCNVWFPGNYIKRHYKNFPSHNPELENINFPLEEDVLLPQPVIGLPHPQYEVIIPPVNDNFVFLLASEAAIGIPPAADL